MKCPRCQQENPPRAKFCLECATPLALRCASCGTQLPAEAKFCFECATPVSAPRSPPRFISPETYTPKHLAERIINSKASLEGERKQVTVLFADLKGSMELLADRDPEEARKILDPVLERMMEAVHHYEGTVNQVMGDGIMALFGAPLAHEDHAVRACYAALRMHEAVRRYADGVRRTQGLLVQIRVGVNSGDVVVRSIGSDLHMDYTAVGQTTHLAARLEQLAAPGSTLVSAETLRMAEGYVQVKPLGPVSIKGLEKPVEVYELAGGGRARTRLQAALTRGLTRFVGRDEEIGQLHRAQASAGQGHGQIVAVVGEPGVGKSRLYYEFTRSHRIRDWLVLESGSVSYGRATPYLPVIDLLREYFHIDPRDGARAIREKVAGKVLTLDRTLEPIVAPLEALFDVAVEGAEWQGLDPLRRRQRTREAVRALLLRESQVQPLVLVFEDLHWIDSETQALLDGFVESLPGARVLLLVNYRPEYRHAWSGKTYYAQFRIDPLPPASAEELIDALVGRGADLRALRSRLIQATEGNPFFIEEMVRTLVETGVLAGERGAFRLARPAEWIEVPATVQAILAARIDRLPPEDKRLLQSAAVVGKDVPLQILEAIAVGPEVDVREGLARLGAAEFVYETSLFPEPEYTFKHALTHEVAYGSLLGERRRELHAAIVAAIERLHADRLGEHVDALAHHARRAESWEKALDYLTQAGTRAGVRLALHEAAEYLEQALATMAHLPRRRELIEREIDIRLQLRGILFPLGQFERIRDHQTEGALRAHEIGDEVRLGTMITSQAHYHAIIAGDTREAVLSARQALEIGTTTGHANLIGRARQVLGMALHGRGEFLPAIATFKTNLEFIEGKSIELWSLGMPVSVSSRVWMAFALADLGRFREAIVTAEEALQESEKLGNLYSLYHACWALGAAYLEQGHHDHAVDPFLRIERIAQQADLPLMGDNASALLAHTRALSGRDTEALALVEVMQATLQRRRNAFTGLRDRLWLGEAYLRCGRVADALETAIGVLGQARTLERRAREADALRLLGDIHVARGDHDEADANYGGALTLATELGMRPAIAHSHAGLGRLGRRAGKIQAAGEQLSTVTTMYREMGMTYWLEKAETELRA